MDYNPFRPEVKANPYPYYAALRSESPVYRVPGTEFFAVSRYRDVVRLLKDTETFSSAGMRILMAGSIASLPGVGKLFGAGPGASLLALVTGGEAGTADADAAPPTPEDILQLTRDLPFDFMEFLKSRILISSDPPAHGPLRALVNRGFTPRRILALEPRLREIAKDATAKMRQQEEFDLVAELTVPLPVTIIAELLGVEPERRVDFKRWSDRIVMGISGSSAGTQSPELLGAFSELTEYFVGVIEARRRQPKEDLISVLVQAQAGETELTNLEVVLFAVLLLAAGNETTTHLIGNAVIALLEHPEQLARVRANPGLIPQVVEETLRFDSPVQVLFRLATRDVEFQGTKIPQGAVVLPLFGSANRDETIFKDPAAFDIDRDTTGHVAFGQGAHFCLGASLARLEARVALETLLTGCSRFHRCDESVDRIDSALLRGPKSLRLRWDA